MARLILFLILACFVSTASSVAARSFTITKTSDDVFERAEDLKQKVVALRLEQKINAPWPDVGKQQGKKPRHVYQKSLEVLGKMHVSGV